MDPSIPSLKARCTASVSAFALLPLLLLPFCLATDHIVGANLGWQLPSAVAPNYNLNYTTWAASQTFVLGDEISFHYPETQYSVYQVNYSTYVNCTFSMYFGHDWIYNWSNKGGRVYIPLNQTMVYYFADGINDHCKQGMKVAVNVTKNATATTKSKHSAQKDSSSASSISVMVTALALVEAFLFISVSFVLH